MGKTTGKTLTEKIPEAESGEDADRARPGLEDWDLLASDPKTDRLACIFKRLRKHFRG